MKSRLYPIDAMPARACVRPVVWACVILVVASLWGCKTSAPAQTPEVAVSRFGGDAQNWDKAARKLPKGAPVVAGLRLDESLTGLRNLMAWTMADPEMFGPNGSLFVEAFKMNWQEVVSGFDRDPLAEASWSEWGFNPRKTIYAGFYPTSSGAGEAFVAGADAIMRERMNVEAGEPLLEAFVHARLTSGEHTFQGLHADVLRAIDGVRPVSGVRIVVPVSDDALFLASVGRVAALTGYEQLPHAPPLDTVLHTGEHVFFNPESPMPAFMVRISEQDAVFDVVFREFQARALPGSERERYRGRVLGDLISAARDYPAGIPAAPRPPKEQVVSLAFAQHETAHLATLRGYIRSLESLRTMETTRRDEHFVNTVIRTLESARGWSLHADEVPGTTYGLSRTCSRDDARAECIMAVDMTFFGGRSLPSLKVPRTQTGLDVSERSLGMSLDLDMLMEPGWKGWLAAGDGAENLAPQDDNSLDPVLALFAAPRIFTLALANIAVTLEEDLLDSVEVEGLLSPIRHVQRVELAQVGHAGMGSAHLGWQSRLVTMLVLKAEAPAEDRHALVELMRSLLLDYVMESTGASALTRTQTRAMAGEPMEQDMLTAMKLPRAHPLFGMQYFYHTGPEAPFLFFSLGLSAQESQRELDRVQASGPAAAMDRDSFYLRLEPLTLRALLFEWLPQGLDPVDLDILIQRLGPATFSIRPDGGPSEKNASTLRFEFELRAPPSL